MELCTSRAISNVLNHKLINPTSHRLNPTPSLSLKRTAISLRIPGLVHHANPLLRATTSEENSIVIDEQQEDQGGATTSEENSIVIDEQQEDQEGPNGVITVENSPDDQQNVAYETEAAEVVKEETVTGEQMQAFEFLEGLNLKLDSEDTYPFLIYGSGALVAVWLTSAVVGAIDSIPVIPKVLELVGLGFTIWFSSRYLILEKNRAELFLKVDELKKEVIGSNDD